MSILTRITPSTQVQARTFAAAFTYTGLRATPVLQQRAGISGTAKKDTGPVETTKSTLKKADRVVSDAALKGINQGERARDKIKNNVGITTEEAKAKAENMKGEAAENAGQGKGKGEQAMGGAKGTTQSAMRSEKH